MKYRLTYPRTRFTAIVLLLTILTSISSPLLGNAAARQNSFTDHSARITNAEIAATLSQSNVMYTAIATDGSAAADNPVTLPKDLSDGVTLTTDDGQNIEITLPNASQAADGEQIASNTTAYPASNGSANAVQVGNDDSMRMLTIIDSPSAPSAYDYKITLPHEGRVELLASGAAILLDNDDNLVATIGAPWAKDANGKSVKTWFTTDGTTLTQHIKHKSKGVAYPITADPWWNWNVALKVTKCTAAVGVLVASSALGLKEIQALGGVTMAARLMIAAGGVTEWAKAALGAASWVLGVQSIRDNCL